MEKCNCNICKNLFYEYKPPKTFICNSCRTYIKLCNEINKTTCENCYEIHIKTNIDNLYNTKETIKHGCGKGSKLIKLAKKHKLSKSDLAKLIRWGI